MPALALLSELTPWQETFHSGSPLPALLPALSPFCSSVFISLVFPSRFCFSEMAPVCAVVGGILAQEIVKVNEDSSPPPNTLWTCPEGALLSLTLLSLFHAPPFPFLPFSSPSHSLQPIPLGIQQMASECHSVLSPELGIGCLPSPADPARELVLTLFAERSASPASRKGVLLWCPFKEGHH